jgi:hypothetical protein
MILDSPGAMAADPDSPAGRKEALRHEKAARDFLDGKHILHLLGASTEQTVEGICIADRALEASTN